MAQTESVTGTVAGYFEDHEDAGRAVEALHEAGFNSTHIGVAHHGHSTKSSSTSRTGEKGESIWEKVKGFFEGNPEPYAEERSEGDLATREITQTPEGTGRYDASDLHDSLNGLSVPEDRSRYFGHRFGKNERGMIVTVNAGDRRAEAESILTRYGADLGENASGYDYSQTDDGAEYQDDDRSDIQGNVQDRDTRDDREMQGTQNMQLLGEVLRIHKERINRGEVRLRKEIVTETQTVQVPVTREEIVIERHGLDSNSPASGSIGESGEIRIPLSEERASVDKATIVREEVSVGKKPVQEVRDLSGEVRHEELVVDDTTQRTGTR